MENEQLIAEYDRKISNNEQRSERLSKEKQQLKQCIHHLEMDMRKSFREIQRFTEESVSQGSQAARWEKNENEGKSAYFTRLVEEQQHQLDQEYLNGVLKLEEERTALQKERNKRWD
ncbi:hypothetical protein JZO83_08050 [Enterococcus sp. DIV1298c]|uniref:hypothetical protein n=1 Tax=Enterococcus sp. DIV1298c TaxID=2815328 RepID=UPI001A913809|nr:hypothetical protein [Enterococcus sp. DIV1298c]MBO0461702.1 hypothetical protein [Enterococcus sp. DIV1298c]